MCNLTVPLLGFLSHRCPPPPPLPQLFTRACARTHTQSLRLPDFLAGIQVQLKQDVTANPSLSFHILFWSDH